MRFIITLTIIFLFNQVWSQTDSLVSESKSDTLKVKIDTISKKDFDTGIIKVIVTDIRKDNCILFGGLWVSKGFLKKDPIRKFASKITGNQMTFTFDSVGKGYYAVAVIQDANNNKKLDVNGIGIPHEGFGFSNNALGDFGPPIFVDCRFWFNGKSKTMCIKMVYLFKNK